MHVHDSARCHAYEIYEPLYANMVENLSRSQSSLKVHTTFFYSSTISLSYVDFCNGMELYHTIYTNEL